MGAGKGGRKGLGPLDYENFSKKDWFLSFEWEKKLHHFWPPPGKIWEKSPGGPPESKYINNTYNRAIDPLQKF